MNSEFTKVFVYGTLLRGEANHRLLARAEMVAKARTKPEYFLVDLGAYPAIIAGGQYAVWGEVYAVDAGTLHRLDQLEGHPHFYTRKTIQLEDGMEAETYVLHEDQVRGMRRICSGDWRARNQVDVE